MRRLMTGVTVAVLALVLGSAEGCLFLLRKTVKSFAIFPDSSIKKLSLCNLIPDLSVAVPFLAIACTIDVILQDITTSFKFGQSKLVMKNWPGDLNQLQPEKYFE